MQRLSESRKEIDGVCRNRGRRSRKDSVASVGIEEGDRRRLSESRKEISTVCLGAAGLGVLRKISWVACEAPVAPREGEEGEPETSISSIFLLLSGWPVPCLGGGAGRARPPSLGGRATICFSIDAERSPSCSSCYPSCSSWNSEPWTPLASAPASAAW